jgi:acetyltransferase-like isoleucine patch superfamily enzyme
MLISPAIRKIGKYSSESYNVTVHHWGEGHVEIGAFCSIAKDVHIMLGGRHNSRAVSTYGFGYGHTDVFRCPPPPLFTKNPNVIIGNDVWIGRWVTIMRGVTIGDGAIVAARSHVTRDVEPYTIVGGNPARFVHYRFGGTVIDQLLKLKWWDLPDEQINELLPFLTSGDVDGLVKKVTEMREKK